MNLRNLDLNLLAAFDTLMRERNVSRAADRMFMTQPAMSHALNRLRQLLHDPVLVRSGADMKPTIRALSLVEPVRHILQDVEQVLGPKPPFVAANAQHEFVIACSDYAECILLGSLIARIKQSAPKVRLRARPCDPNRLTDQLETGEVDAAIGTISSLTLLERVMSARLFADNALCCLGQQNSFSGAVMTLPQFVELDHLLVSPWGKQYSFIDDWLHNAGLKRHLSHIVTHFAAAPFVVAETDLVLTLPGRLAEQFARFAPLRLVNTTPEFPHYVVHMLWHPSRDTDPACRWLREQILHVSYALQPQQREPANHTELPCVNNAISCPIQQSMVNV